MTNLFTGRGDSCVRYDIPLYGVRWADISRVFMEKDIGTLIAYLSQEGGTVHTNPPSDSRIDCQGLYVIVREGKNISQRAVRGCSKRTR